MSISSLIKRTFRHVRPAKIQISLRIRAVWSESSPGAFWIAKDAKFLHADNEDSDQTVRMRRLIWVFVVRTFRRYVFSRCGSNTFPTYMSCTVELSVFEFLASADCYLFCGFVDFLHINGQPVVKSPLETYCRLLILSRQYDPFCLL